MKLALVSELKCISQFIFVAGGGGGGGDGGILLNFLFWEALLQSPDLIF